MGLKEKSRAFAEAQTRRLKMRKGTLHSEAACGLRKMDLRRPLRNLPEKAGSALRVSHLLAPSTPRTPTTRTRL